MWAARIVHEASVHECIGGNSFVTLTYRDSVECDSDQYRQGLYVPDDWSLHKSHFQKFMKRLRKCFSDQRIRFFHCGEYGRTCRHGLHLDTVACPVCNVGRPHYHAILFNCSFPDLEKYTQVNGEDRFTSPLLERLWKYGFVDVGAVNFESAAYVARYALKKVTGVRADEWYADRENGCWRQPEYCTMSRRPGIGRDWYEQYKSDLFPSDEVPIPGSGVFKGMPRYYEALFEREDPLCLQEIKELRQVFRRENAGEYTPERLMDKYKCMKARLELRQRSL